MEKLKGYLFLAFIAVAGCGGSGGGGGITQTTPVITWATPAPVVVGTTLSTTQLNAAANVAGTFVYTPAAGTVESTPGTVTLSTTFSPADPTDYTTATASVSLVVGAKSTPVITWATPAPIAVGASLSSTQLGASANVPGTFVYTPALGTVESTAGTVTLSTTFTPTDTLDYTTATASVSLSVTPATPVITWATPAQVMVGTALSSTQLDATANVPGKFVYSPAAGTVESTLGTVKLSTTFTPTDTADYTTATDSVTLVVAAQATPVITWATPAAVVTGTALSSTQLDASANVPGKFVYTPAAGTVESTAGTVTLSTTFTPTDTVNYTTATDSVSLLVVPASGGATVDFGTTYQTIRGFGGSEAWAGAMPNAQISALFGTTGTDIGLTILRLRIAPATWTSATKTADTTAWTTELDNGLAAQALGATIFASPWSAPASMKTNGSVNEGSLSTTSYADYAAYLNAYTSYAQTLNVNLYAISMQNEPDWNPCDPNGTDEGPNGKDCYESCLWTAAQMDTWVAGYGSTLTTKLMMPESASFNAAMSSTALNDANAVNSISIVGGHLYGGPPTYPTLAKSKGKDVWMTEHYLNPIRR